MDNKDKIKDLFADKFNQFEVPVNPELWSSIASQIGTNSAVVSSSVSLLTKGIIGLSSVAAIATAVYFFSKDNEHKTETPIQKKENVLVKVDENSIKSEIINTPIKKQNQPFTAEYKQQNFLSETHNNTKQDEVVFNENSINKTNTVLEKSLEEKTNVSPDPVVLKSPEKSEIVKLEKPDPVIEKNVEKITKSSKVINLPNTFTPNNDGINDVLFIEAEGISMFNLVVLDQENKIVFQTNDPSFQWNGEGLDNLIVPSGNYIYYFTGLDENGKQISKSSMLRITSNR